jgi:hypothetical protein
LQLTTLILLQTSIYCESRARSLIQITNRVFELWTSRKNSSKFLKLESILIKFLTHLFENALINDCLARIINGWIGLKCKYTRHICLVVANLPQNYHTRELIWCKQFKENSAEDRRIHIHRENVWLMMFYSTWTEKIPSTKGKNVVRYSP